MKTNLLKFGLGILCLMNFAFAQIIPQNGLVAYYALDGNADADSAICMNNGTNNGALSTTNSCNMANRAMSFDGVSDYIEIAHCQGLEVSNGLSICAWVKPKALNYVDVCRASFIVSKGHDHQAGHFQLMFIDTVGCNPGISGILGFIFGIDETNNIVSGVSTVDNYALNNWYFVVGTFDKNIYKIYVNATLKNSQAVPTFNIPINTQNLFIGEMPNPNSTPALYHANADIDDVVIYNRPLTAQEILDMYNQHCWTTAIEDKMQDAIKLFPNPANEMLQIEWNTMQPERVEIIDFTGKSVLQKALETSNLTTGIEVSSLAKGMYLVKIVGKEG